MLKMSNASFQGLVNMTSYDILLANMRRCRNSTMHTLLETNAEDDILCLQEPWFSRVGTSCDDEAHSGRDVLGGAAHRNWTIHYPYFTDSKWAKVMIYVHKFTQTHGCKQLPIQIVPCNDLVQHASIMIVDAYADKSCLRIINFYHDTDDPTCLRTLMALDMDITIPTLLIGDFNLHSRTWSPPGWTTSPHALLFKEWAADNTFSLMTAPGDITWRGTEDERPSTLDLMWHNMAVDELIVLTPPTIDWEASMGSNHASICTHWIFDGSLHLQQIGDFQTFKIDRSENAQKL